MPTSRVEAFSDGVFAIAITLLVLDVRPPHSAPGELARELAHQWPSYASYAVSFAIIGIIWVNHHSMFERIVRVDRLLMFLNLGLLLTVALLPFPTALLADYIRSGTNSHIAAAVYSTNMTLIGVAFLAMWIHLVRTSALLDPGFPREAARVALRRSVLGPVVYALSIGVAFLSAPLCLAIYAGAAIFFAITYVPNPQPGQAPSAPEESPPPSVSSA